MTRFIAIRHAETEWNRQRRLQGGIESPLSGAGLAQVALLRLRLQAILFAHVYFSDTERARATADGVIGDRQVVATPDRALREMDLGCWQGFTFEQVARRWPDSHDAFWNTPERYRSPCGGEDFAGLVARVEAALARYRARYSSGSILLVTHSLVLKAIWLAVTRRPISDFWVTSEFLPGAVSVFDLEDSEFVLRALNDGGHSPLLAIPGGSLEHG